MNPSASVALALRVTFPFTRATPGAVTEIVGGVTGATGAETKRETGAESTVDASAPVARATMVCGPAEKVVDDSTTDPLKGACVTKVPETPFEGVTVSGVAPTPGTPPGGSRKNSTLLTKVPDIAAVERKKISEPCATVALPALVETLTNCALETVTTNTGEVAVLRFGGVPVVTTDVSVTIAVSV